MLCYIALLVLTSNDKYIILSKLGSKKGINYFFVYPNRLCSSLSSISFALTLFFKSAFSLAVVGMYNAFVEVMSVLIVQETIITHLISLCEQVFAFQGDKLVVIKEGPTSKDGKLYVHTPHKLKQLKGLVRCGSQDVQNSDKNQCM